MQFRFPLRISGLGHPTAEYLAKTLPTDMLLEMVIPMLAFFKSCTLCSHDQYAFLLRIAVIRITFCDGKQTIKGIFKEPGNKPVIQRRCENDNIRFHVTGLRKETKTVISPSNSRTAMNLYDLPMILYLSSGVVFR